MPKKVIINKVSTKNTVQCRGFTIIELSILLVVFSFVVINVLVARDESESLGVTRNTNAQLQKIKEMLDKHALEYGFYPCPADPTDDVFTDASLGEGSRDTSGNCNADNIDSPGTTPGQVFIGAVPVKELGLLPEDMLDSWDRRILYAVAENVTQAATYWDNNPDIIILRGYDDQVTTNPKPLNQDEPDIITNTAAYALVSFGEDGVGGYERGGERVQAIDLGGGNYIDSARQNINHHLHTNTAMPSVDRAFFKGGTSQDPDIQFDDIVEYGHRACVPYESTLPYSANLVVWFDAADCESLTYNDIGLVTEWKNKSTTKDLTSSGTARPGFAVRAAQNELPVIDFDGSDNMLTQTFATTYTQPVTIFIVTKSDDVATANAHFFDGIGTANRHELSMSTTVPDWRMQSGGTGFNAGAGGSSPTIFTTIFNTSSSNLYVNGGGNAGSVTAATLDGLTIGSDYTPANYLDGYIAEILVYNEAMGAADRQSVECYLEDKWGITITGHSCGP